MFSERYGFKVRGKIQIESMDTELRNRLWNQFDIYYFDSIFEVSNIDIEFDLIFFTKMYDEFFKLTEVPRKSNGDLFKDIKKRFLNMEWFEVYNFIEYVSNNYYDKDIQKAFIKSVNDVLEKEMSGYRFVNNYIAPIIDEVEIKEVEESL